MYVLSTSKETELLTPKNTTIHQPFWWFLMYLLDFVHFETDQIFFTIGWSRWGYVSNLTTEDLVRCGSIGGGENGWENKTDYWCLENSDAEIYIHGVCLYIYFTNTHVMLSCCSLYIAIHNQTICRFYIYLQDQERSDGSGMSWLPKESLLLMGIGYSTSDPSQPFASKPGCYISRKGCFCEVGEGGTKFRHTPGWWPISPTLWKA